MNHALGRFERIARTVPPWAEADTADLVADAQHPFETRNIHPDLPSRVRELFDDGYLSESVFAAFTFVEVEVKRMSAFEGKTGEGLMGAVFGSSPPIIRLNNGLTDSDADEQRGYQNLFKGSSAAIRNPRAHDVFVPDTPDQALDYLALASLLLRKLDLAGRSAES